MAVDTEDWIMGEDAESGGVRSFSHPEERGDPIHRTELSHSTEPHSGAGVGNKVAWRIGKKLGRDEMARVYVAALQSGELRRGAGYAELAAAVRNASVRMYGADSRGAKDVDDSWTQAGY